MHRYNLFSTGEEGLEGLHVMKTEAYVSLIRDMPGLVHDNAGDFYSDFSVDELPDRINAGIISGLSEFDVSGRFEVISESEFRNPRADGEYIITGEQGVRVYLPDSHKRDQSHTFIYTLLSFAFVDEIVSEEPKGSFTKELDELAAVVDEMPTR